VKFISTKRRKITSTEGGNLVVRNKAKSAKNICQRDKIYVEAIKLADRGWDHKHTSEIQVTEFTFLSTKKRQLETNN
jgi:single-strand DNA-binding protein